MKFKHCRNVRDGVVNPVPPSRLGRATRNPALMDHAGFHCIQPNLRSYGSVSKKRI